MKKSRQTTKGIDSDNKAEYVKKSLIIAPNLDGWYSAKLILSE